MRTFRFVITWIIINLLYDFLYSLGGSFLCCLVEIIGLFICAVISIPWLKVVLISAGLLMIDLLLMFSGFSGFEVLHRPRLFCRRLRHQKLYRTASRQSDLLFHLWSGTAACRRRGEISPAPPPAILVLRHLERIDRQWADGNQQRKYSTFIVFLHLKK